MQNLKTISSSVFHTRIDIATERILFQNSVLKENKSTKQT